MEDEPNISEEIKTQKRKEIDKLSLELLSNTSQYKKYLAKNDPNEYVQSRTTSTRLKKHKERVMTMLMDLLDEYDDLTDDLRIDHLDDQSERHPRIQSVLSGRDRFTTFSNTGNTEIQRQFKQCVDKILDFVEWTSYKHKSGGGGGDNDDDTLFGSIEEPKETPSAVHFGITNTAKSFWGKKVTKSR